MTAMISQGGLFHTGLRLKIAIDRVQYTYFSFFVKLFFTSVQYMWIVSKIKRLAQNIINIFIGYCCQGKNIFFLENI
jgi:hypothetical protein